MNSETQRLAVTRGFARSSGLLLLTMAAALVIAAGSEGGLAHAQDPILGLSGAVVFRFGSVLAFVVALLCLFGEKPALQAAWVVWLAANFWIYRFGLEWYGYQNLKVYFETLHSAFGVPSPAIGVLTVGAFGYLTIAGGAILAWLLAPRSRQSSSQEYLKMACPVCGGHIAFPAPRTGERLACPHCGGTITLNTACEVHKDENAS